MDAPIVNTAGSTQGSAIIASAGQPIKANKETGEVQIATPRGLVVNSLLKKDEWVALERRVLAAAQKPLRFVSALQGSGLVHNHGSIGVLMSEWGMLSEMTPAEASMTGRGRAERDRAEYKLAGVPVPVIHKEFEIGDRELEAARLMGTPINTDNAAAAARVVAEYIENMALNGDDTINFGGSQIFGILNYKDAITDTAANFSGGSGDWSTPGQAEATVAGMIRVLQSQNMAYGPYRLIVGTGLWNDVNLTWLANDSEITPYDRITSIAEVTGVEHVPFMPDGTAALVQWDDEVIELGVTWEPRVVEVASPLIMSTTFRVVAIQTIRVKSRYEGESGIAVATGA